MIDFLSHRGKHGLQCFGLFPSLLKKTECDTVFLVNVVLKLLNVSTKSR